MSLSRTLLSIASILMGVSAAFAQANEFLEPPLFQGIMMDAKGKTVGRIYIDIFGSGATTIGTSSPFNVVLRQIGGIWVALAVADFTSGFTSIPASDFTTYYQSADCVGPALMYVNSNKIPNVTAPALGVVTTIPPATTPSIYFAGAPASVVTLNSLRQGGNCASYANQIGYLGPIQSVPVSTLHLTLPFSVK